MHDGLDFARQRILDKEHTNKHLVCLDYRSKMLRRVLGISDFNEPFDPPPPPLDHDIESAAGVGPMVDPVAHLSPSRLDTATAMTQLMGEDYFPQTPSSHFAYQQLQPHSKQSSKLRVSAEPTRRKYHPDLLGFKFPRASPPRNQDDPKTDGPICHDTLTGREHIDQKEDTTAKEAAPAPIPLNFQPAGARTFDVYRDSERTDSRDRLSKDSPKHAENNAPSHTEFNRNITIDNSNLSHTTEKFLSPPLPHSTLYNIVPQLQDLFEQWIRFGRESTNSLRMLPPREIPLISIAARTVPCSNKGSSGQPPEMPTKLFNIVVGKDVADLKMFECEVIPEPSVSCSRLLNIDRRPYHETSSANPNIWTVLLIREKPQRSLEGAKIGLGKAKEVASGTGVHVAKKRRGIQGPDVETPMLSEFTQHSWQIIAWPSAHVMSFMEVQGPVQQKSSGAEMDKKSQGRAAGRTPLAPKIVQVRQRSRSPVSRDGRVHPDHARVYAASKATARLRVASLRDFSDGTSQVAQNKENLGSSPPLLAPFNTVNTVTGLAKLHEENLTDVSGLSISDNPGHNSVHVYETQRLTCLRFLRGGNYPLLAGKHVDLSYWNTFCEYFGRGEIQLEIISDADGEPVLLSTDEQLRRRCNGRAVNMASGRDDKTKGPRKSAKNMQAALDFGSSVSDVTERKDVRKPHSSQLSRRNYTPDGQPQTGTGGTYELLPKGGNTARQPSLHRRSTLAFSRPMLEQQSQKSSLSDDNTTACSQQNSGYSVAGKQVKSQIIGRRDNDSDNARTADFLHINARSRAELKEGQDAPLMRGWQVEMLTALHEERKPAWDGWTDRSELYKDRTMLREKTMEREAKKALHYWKERLFVLGDTRAGRDGIQMVQYYKNEVERRQRDIERIQQEWLSERLDEEQEQLGRNEMKSLPSEHLQCVSWDALQRFQNRKVSSETQMGVQMQQVPQRQMYAGKMVPGQSLAPMGYYSSQRQTFPNNIPELLNARTEALWILPSVQRPQVWQSAGASPAQVVWQFGPRSLTEDQLNGYSERAQDEFTGYEDEEDDDDEDDEDDEDFDNEY